jgi:NAD(P)-dependent dehydrogenase (short-subunit alcohol dehydrogenase family)
MKNLEGRVALITGALRGIGEACVARFAEEEATVIGADLKPGAAPDVREFLSKYGKRVSYLELDVAKEEQWSAAAAEIRERFGRLDILVNNAGVDCVGPVESIGIDAWRRIMSVNVDGVFLGVKHLTPLLSETGKKTPAGSSVINISSIMGLVGYSETSAYNASKGAVRLFTKSTAIEFARKRMAIRANSVHPGFVKTPLLDIGMRRWAEQGLAPSAQALIDQLDEATPLGRIASPDEIAAVCCFLASDDSSYCTGAEFVVDGGWTAQ